MKRFGSKTYFTYLPIIFENEAEVGIKTIFYFMDHCIYEMMLNSVHFAKSTPFRALSVSFQYSVSMFM